MAIARPDAPLIKATVMAADAQVDTLTISTPNTRDPLVVAVGPGDAAIGYVGKEIQGNLIPANKELNSLPRLENIWPMLERRVNDTAQKLHADTQSRGSNVVRMERENFPVFALVNQNGDLISDSELKGHWTLISFLFTSCRNPSMCPAVRDKMIMIQEILKMKKSENVQLRIFTFDPATDTPGILRAYADSHGADSQYLQFLTGPNNEVRDLMKQMGIHLREDSDHTMAFLIVDPTGRIVYREEGNNWEPESILRELKTKQTNVVSFTKPGSVSEANGKSS